MAGLPIYKIVNVVPYTINRSTSNNSIVVFGSTLTKHFMLKCMFANSPYDTYDYIGINQTNDEQVGLFIKLSK